MNFRHTLDKSSKKFPCPSCGKKRFVKFVDIQTGEYLEGVHGKCDRSDSCGYTSYPKLGDTCYFIDIKSITEVSEKAFKITDLEYKIHFIPKSMILEIEVSGIWVKEFFLKSSSINYSGSLNRIFYQDGEIFNPIPIEQIPEPKPSFHTIGQLEGIVNNPIDCKLASYLKTRFKAAEVNETLIKYNTGNSSDFWKDSTCFFQVDQEQNIRAGKVMLYSKTDGRRVKDPFPHINWIHNLKESEFNLSQCLFGLHLVNDLQSNKPIAIVESEKTAIVMAMINKDCIWMACGSKTAINEKILTPIKQRSIILYPDKGSFPEWLKRAEGLNTEGFKIMVSGYIENNKRLTEGADIADLHLKN